jgi:hypothetical protein
MSGDSRTGMSRDSTEALVEMMGLTPTTPAGKSIPDRPVSVTCGKRSL